jgi:hypothetical protein
MQRKKSRGSKQHTSKNITLGNTLVLMTFDVLMIFQTAGFVVSSTIPKKLSQRNLKVIFPKNFENLAH